ncbi:MAG: type II toxin-antitoxin system VapC family toxin [Tepidiformaceae bacterium]
MILLDTHVWLWWVGDRSRLSDHSFQVLEATPPDEIALSLFSGWEIAKLVDRGRMGFDRPVEDWMTSALEISGTSLLGLTLEILVEATRLPQPFHRDPADQIIVATSRVLGLPLLTQDRQILAYEHVEHAKLQELESD